MPLLLLLFLPLQLIRGLAHSGEEGVYNVVKLLNDELALAMKLMGAITISVTITTIIHSFVLLFICSLNDTSSCFQQQLYLSVLILQSLRTPSLPLHFSNSILLSISVSRYPTSLHFTASQPDSQSFILLLLYLLSRLTNCAFSFPLAFHCVQDIKPSHVRTALSFQSRL